MTEQEKNPENKNVEIASANMAAKASRSENFWKLVVVMLLAVVTFQNYMYYQRTQELDALAKPWNYTSQPVNSMYTTGGNASAIAPSGIGIYQQYVPTAYVSNGKFIVTILAPDMEKRDVKVELRKGYLILRGGHPDILDTTDRTPAETATGSIGFINSFKLPFAVDAKNIKVYKSGDILAVIVPGIVSSAMEIAPAIPTGK